VAEDKLTVRAWKRYGHDRLYVSDGEGHRLGYLDCKTGNVHVGDEVHRNAVTCAVAAGSVDRTEREPLHTDEHPSPAAAPPMGAHPYAVTIDRLALDLAKNTAGGSAAARGHEMRQQAPVRTLLARLFGVHTDERAWRVGARGERICAHELTKLGEGWSVIHDVPVGTRGANIDHVLVGPAGVFTVNAKYHAGKTVWVGGDTVLIDGHRQPYVRNARHEAARASRLLSAVYGTTVPVTGIVAVLAQAWTVKSQPADGLVLVMQPSKARRHLRALAERWTSQEVERLQHLARRSVTWQPGD
jgi:hypothetical protein